ncbi:MAG: SRPBCC family protein [Polyangiaceae bacterium]
MKRVEVERVIAAPPEEVFARYTDHAGWSRWAGAGKVSLAREGSPDRNGVGCVRSFDSAFGLQEEVVEFDPPRHMAYRVVRGGFPIKDHRGEVTFEPHPRGTRVVWSVSIGSRLPFTERAIGRFLGMMFARFLRRFEERGLQAS